MVMIKRRIVLHFPPDKVDQAVIYHLARDFNLVFNILQARVTPRRKGLLVMEISGKEDDYGRGMEYLREAGVTIQPLSRDITRNDEKCTHCGACLAVCPTDALRIDPDSQEVIFNNDECVACEACVAACPARAMEVKF